MKTTWRMFRENPLTAVKVTYLHLLLSPHLWSSGSSACACIPTPGLKPDTGLHCWHPVILL